MKPSSIPTSNQRGCVGQLESELRNGTSQSDECGARRFCIVFTMLALVAFASTATLNFIVNPYAQYPTSMFEPMVQTSRAQKVTLLREQRSVPDGLILGSSRVLKIEPDYLRQKTGLTFFNGGMNQAKPEECLAFFRFFKKEFGTAPKMLILGLDINSFNDKTPTDARLLSNSDLAPLVPEAISTLDRMQPLSELLSWQQTKSSIKSLKLNWASNGLPESSESFRPDGLIVYHQREAEIAQGEYDFEAALEYNQNEYRHLFKIFGEVSQDRRRVFETLVNECEAADCELAVFLTPIHPLLEQHLSDKTEYPRLRSEVTAYLRDTARQSRLSFADFSIVDCFAGDPNQFVDGIHPLETNTRRIADELLLVHDRELRGRFVASERDVDDQRLGEGGDRNAIQ